MHHIELDARSALAEYRRREEAKKAADENAADSEAKEGEALSYLGEITRLNVPSGARLSAVSPDGSKLLVAHRERDDRIFTLQDLWVIDQEIALQAPDTAAFQAGMRNISASLDRQVLHAAKLTFVHPASGETMTFTDDLPEDLASFLQRLPG